MTDYRELKNRREGFKRWFAWSVKYKDADPALFMLNYLFDRFEYNIEQRLWVCWLYGTTYYVPTAWIIQNEFPDMELVDQTRLEKWNSENYRRLRYQTDTKYNKGFLPAQFASYRSVVMENGCTSQREFFRRVCSSTDPVKNFNALWEVINEKMFKFGRYTAWFYMQALKDCCGLNIEAPDLFLRSYDGSRSHRNGLHFALGQDNKIDQKLDPKEYDELEKNAASILAELKAEHPDLQFDNFLFETVLCSYKKLFRKKRGRYLGYYIDRQSEEIRQVEQDGWSGIDWSVLWDARKETLDHRLIEKSFIQESKFPLFLETGSFDRLEWMFKDEEDSESTSLMDLFS